jgi:hypothetical protein
LKPSLDPRRGDIEDDASSSKRRSLLSLAGSLLAEVSILKVVVAWILLIVMPGFLLGIVPIMALIWFSKLSAKLRLIGRNLARRDPGGCDRPWLVRRPPAIAACRRQLLL